MQKETVNWKRQQSYNFKKENKIWLNLKNIYTDWLCKKFDVKNIKYIIVKKISSHFFCLNTLSEIHNVFHSVMLQSAAIDSFSSQHMTDLQFSSQIVSNEEEFKIEKILKKRFIWCRKEFKKKYLLWKQKGCMVKGSKEGLNWKTPSYGKRGIMYNTWESLSSLNRTCSEQF